MHIDPIAVVGVVVLTLLAVLLTGPGMWSEKWGWKWFGGRGREKRDADERGPQDPPGPR